ncbi:MAG: hypothetical protein LBR40_04625, partial [Bacilli bacterium]|nr:hypothetical protein [Bacilli bacterium]
NYNFLLCAAQNLKKICRLKAIEYAIEQENKENGPTICIFNKLFDYFSKLFDFSAPIYKTIY